MLDGLQDDDPPLQRDGQGGQFEVGAERAAVVVAAAFPTGTKVARAAMPVEFTRAL